MVTHILKFYLRIQRALCFSFWLDYVFVSLGTTSKHVPTVLSLLDRQFIRLPSFVPWQIAGVPPKKKSSKLPSPSIFQILICWIRYGTGARVGLVALSRGVASIRAPFSCTPGVMAPGEFNSWPDICAWLCRRFVVKTRLVQPHIWLFRADNYGRWFTRILWSEAGNCFFFNYVYLHFLELDEANRFVLTTKRTIWRLTREMCKQEI